MRFRALLLALTLGTSPLVAGAVPAEPGAQTNSLRCGPRFRSPGFADTDDFAQAVQALGEPWRELLEPDKSPEYDASDEIVAPGALEVDVVHHSREKAIVFAQYKANRTAPFSAVIFLLSRQGSRWHVTDFVRRSVSYMSYSAVGTPKMLKLRPVEHLHFYFTTFIGGRKLEVGTDEFYMVEGNRLRRTLLLKNVVAFISPADSWREFDQSAQVVAFGRLRILVQRTWGLENGEERKQRFAVTFHWNPRRKEFASPNKGTLFVNEPSPWTSKGLPAPPAEK